MGESTCGELATGLDHHERDACLHKLGDHYAAGRLTADELDSRIEAALAATTEADLAAVMSDLSVDPLAGQDRDQAPPGSLAPSRTRSGSYVRRAVGQGSKALELLVRLAVRLLGPLTHLWPSREPGRQHGDEVGDDLPAPMVAPEPAEAPASTEDRPGRPVGRGSGAIPAQRRGD